MSETKAAGAKPADTAPNAEALATASRDAVTADRTRRAAIMALPEAKGREPLAEHLYATTEMDADAIKATLTAAPGAPQAEADDADPEVYDKVRMASAGLGGTGKPKAKGYDLKAAMTKMVGG